MIGFYHHSLNHSKSGVHNYVKNCKMLLVELYDYYSSVYNPDRDMSKRVSVSVCPTRFHQVIANIISQDNSFIGHFSSSRSSSYIEVDNYLKNYFEIEQDSFNILEW